MKFSQDTKIIVDAFEESIPVIHGQNYYIDAEGYVNTYTLDTVPVFDTTNKELELLAFRPITEFIAVINNRLAFKTTQGWMVTNMIADKEKYVGGFQGIVGFDENTVKYSFINNNAPAQSTVKFTGRINNQKRLEIQVDENTWVTPLGEFRCYIKGNFFNANYNSTLPNSFGATFEVVLAGWTSAEVSPATNYIKDIHVCGNTLYLSCRLNAIGTTPFDWTKTDTSDKTVIWTEDSRLVGCNILGHPSSSYFFMVNLNTSAIYWVNAADFNIEQEYQHRLPILGCASIDKYMLAITDKESVSLISAYISLNTWLIKTKAYFKLNQLSAYEDITNQYESETVEYCDDINTIIIKSTQRASILLYISNGQILSGCHTVDEVIPGRYQTYLISNKKLYLYQTVEDSGEYNPVDLTTGVTNFDSFIYIGSDLEPDVGGSTMRDTEIIFEGKLAIVDGSDVSVESSGDVPKSTDLPIRTDQNNPDNSWYLYAKTLRYPISYTDWIKISMMPTTRIMNISLAADATKKNEGKKGSKK